MADLYSEIRPYRDAEVSAVVDALLSDNEFIDTLIALRGNKVAQWLPGVARLFARRFLRKQLVGVDTVEAFQGLVKPRLDKVVASTSAFTSDGIEQLSAESSYLFISNHRDIVMDSAYANIVLVEQNFRFAASVADRHYVVDQGKVVDMIPNDQLEENAQKLHDYLGV